MLKKKRFVLACIIALIAPLTLYATERSVCTGQFFTQGEEILNVALPTVNIITPDMPQLMAGESMTFSTDVVMDSGGNASFFWCTWEGKLESVDEVSSQVKFTAPSIITEDRVIRLGVQISDDLGYVGGDNIYIYLVQSEAVDLPPPNNNGKVTICHKDRKTLNLPESALDSHLNHGDILGTCPNDDDDDSGNNVNDDSESKAKDDDDSGNNVNDDDNGSVDLDDVEDNSDVTESVDSDDIGDNSDATESVDSDDVEDNSDVTESVDSSDDIGDNSDATESVDSDDVGDNSDDTSSPAKPKLPAPTNFTAISNGHQIELSWDNVEGNYGYQIFRSNTSSVPIDGYHGYIAQNVTYYIDTTNLVCGNTYYYRISAMNNGQLSPKYRVDHTCIITDNDGDSIADSSDNCPSISNSSQADTDNDGIGDVCEADADGDGIADDSDNCPSIANSNQADSDSNGIGDACDTTSTQYELYPIYSFWFPQNKTHFFTINEIEKDNILATYPTEKYQYSGIAYYAYKAEDAPAGTSPVYRFWFPQNKMHFYTMSEAEKDHILATYPAEKYQYGGIAWYAYKTSDAPEGTSPVYRFWFPQNKTHFYTMNENEKNNILNTYPAEKYQYGGIAWYAYQ